MANTPDSTLSTDDTNPCYPWSCDRCGWAPDPIKPKGKGYSGWTFMHNDHEYDWPPVKCPTCSVKQRERKRESERLGSIMEFHEQTPPQYRDVTLDGLSPAGRDACSQFINNTAEWLLLISGETGRGKTHVGFAVCQEWLRECEPHHVYFRSVPSIVAAIRNETMGRGETRGVEWFATFNGVLFMDDLAVEKVSEFTIQELYRIINYREQWQLPTIITTELSLDDIAARLVDRIASRLSTGIHVEMKGADRRLARRKSATPNPGEVWYVDEITGRRTQAKDEKCHKE